jgi:hypothetical protein
VINLGEALQSTRTRVGQWYKQPLRKGSARVADFYRNMWCKNHFS